MSVDMKTTKERQEREKPQVQLVPRTFVEQVAERLSLGARQRGEYNWRRGAMLSASVYVGKALRHLHAYADGEIADAEGGSHLAAAGADIAIMLDAAAHGQLQIDLPGHGVKVPEVREYCVWYNDDTREWAAEESPLHGSVIPPGSSCSLYVAVWMFVAAVMASSETDAIAIAQQSYRRLPTGSAHT